VKTLSKSAQEFDAVRVASEEIFRNWLAGSRMTFSAAERLPLLDMLCSPQLFAYMHRNGYIDADGVALNQKPPFGPGLTPRFFDDPTIGGAHVVVSPIVFHLLVTLISLHDRGRKPR